MKREISKGYYIQETELSIALAMKGMKELYGIRLSGIESITQETIYQTIFAMLRKEMLNKSRDCIQIEDVLDRWIDTIQNARRFIVCADADDLTPERYFYVAGEDAILIQPVRQQSSLLCMEKVTGEEVQEAILESWFPQNTQEMTECKAPPAVLCEAARAYWSEDKESILGKSQVKQLLQEYDIPMKCKRKQVMKFDLGLDAYLVYSDEQEDKVFDMPKEGGEKL